MADPDEQVVKFSVKELFLDLKADLKRIEGKLEHVATQADLDAVVTRVAALETSSASAAAVNAYKKWLIGLALALGADIALGFLPVVK